MLALKTADFIFCRDDLQGLHRDHAICHELGHLLAGHTEHPEAADIRQGLGLDLLVLERNCHYGAEREQEAETIADVIMGRVVEHLSPRQTPGQRALRGFDDALS